MSLLETMSYGITPIDTPVGSIPQVVKDGENGVFIKDHDSDSFVTAVKQMDANRAQLRKLGEKARKTRFKQFSQKKYIKEINDIYSNLDNGF